MSSVPSQTEAQEREAVKIHQALFGRGIPDKLKHRFIEASNLDRSTHAHGLERYYQIIAGVRDLEALEVAGRYTGRLPLLSHRFQLMVFLAESLPENRSDFIKERSSVVRGVSAVIVGALRTGYKLLKGIVLLRARRV